MVKNINSVADRAGGGLDDRTRILLTIIAGLQDMRTWKPDTLLDMHGVWFDIHSEQVIPGDLVYCVTSGIHEATVGIATSIYDRSEGRMQVRVLGSDRIVDVSNERFYIIRGLRESDTWEGEKRLFYYRVLEAFSIGIDGKYYFHRFGGLRYEGNEAVITVRPHAWMADRVEPREIRVPFAPKLTGRQLYNRMVKLGYADEWQPKPKEQEARISSEKTHSRYR